MHAVMMTEFGGPESLVYGEIDSPAVHPGWVEVDLRASGLNWHDVLVRRGRYDSPLPHVPGADGAGVRTDTGEEVLILPSLFWGNRSQAPGAEWQILGDTTSGTYAERVSVPEECLAPKPESWSWEQAAALPLVGVTCFRALITRAGLTAGESLLIVGAGGGVATMAVHIAVAVGAHVIVAGSTASKIEQAQQSGAASGVLHSAGDWPAQAKKLSPDGEGFDVILDPVGLWDRSVAALRHGGRLVVLGANVAEEVRMDVRGFYFGQYSLLGTTMGGPQDFRGLLELVVERAVQPPPIARIFRLSQAAEAHRALEAGDSFGKIILLP
ncbi:zinc-binding dehydrogenase [Gordonia terrae]|uniref:quinone oxidoreductase family protein n=1 Tax=Gordonia terrae TaxID=2055 RepID=UPI00200AF357|nr:zinc-binding dehydrogenase [Gordonia terrae]UPW08512.1 zinc-binding dehydrogenase [Gordonia terrae]